MFIFEKQKRRRAERATRRAREPGRPGRVRLQQAVPDARNGNGGHAAGALDGRLRRGLLRRGHRHARRCAQDETDEPARGRRRPVRAFFFNFVYPSQMASMLIFSTDYQFSIQSLYLSTRLE